MNSEIEAFFSELSRIGSRDDSLYDTHIKESILRIIAEQPPARELVTTESIDLSQSTETQQLIAAIRSLLLAYERSPADYTLEGAIANYVRGLPTASKQLILVDEIFGDYFDKSPSGDNVLAAPIRRFFYSDKCYIALTFVPAIAVGLLMLANIPDRYGEYYIVATILACFAVFLGGDALHDYLNKKIQKYEGKI